MHACNQKICVLLININLNQYCDSIKYNFGLNYYNALYTDKERCYGTKVSGTFAP